MDVFKKNGGTTAGVRGTLNKGGHGQAALFLIESLMHALVAKGALSREEFIEVVDGAAEVELELITVNALSPSDRSGSFLYPLADAFKRELGQ